MSFYRHTTIATSFVRRRYRSVRYRAYGAARGSEGKFRHIGCPIAGLAVEAIGGTAKDKGNIFALGLVARMFDSMPDALS